MEDCEVCQKRPRMQNRTVCLGCFTEQDGTMCVGCTDPPTVMGILRQAERDMANGIPIDLKNLVGLVTAEIQHDLGGDG